MSLGTIQPENLIALSRKPDRDSRKRLLEELTELFIITAHTLTEEQRYSFGEILYFITVDLGTSEKRKLAQNLAGTNYAPKFLVNFLISESIEIAAPLLEHSSVFTEKELTHIALTKNHEYLTAMAGRNDLSQDLISIILGHGNDEALARLSQNQYSKRADWLPIIRRQLEANSA